MRSPDPHAAAPAPRRRLQPEKREAITHAARAVFGRDGYSRTSIDAIAAEAGVSTRTIYNHFESKEQLFSSVLHESATQVAEAILETVARDFSGGDPEGDLVVVGRALAAQRTDFPEHFAMVGQITAEAAHFPPGSREVWQEAGPRRVLREVVRRLQQLADRGLLRLENPTRAAYHFMGLTTLELGTRSCAGEPPVSEADRDEMIVAGVRAFLYGYAA